MQKNNKKKIDRICSGKEIDEIGTCVWTIDNNSNPQSDWLQISIVKFGNLIYLKSHKEVESLVLVIYLYP